MRDFFGFIFLAFAGLLIGAIMGKMIVRDGTPDHITGFFIIFCAIMVAAGFLFAGFSRGWL